MGMIANPLQTIEHVSPVDAATIVPSANMGRDVIGQALNE
jgi:hypothetical protein